MGRASRTVPRPSSLGTVVGCRAVCPLSGPACFQSQGYVVRRIPKPRPVSPRVARQSPHRGPFREMRGFLLCKPVSLTILFSAELGNIDRGRREIRLKLTDFCYTDSTSWDQDTCYLFHRHVSHLAGNVDKSMACRERLRSLDVSRMGEEAKIIFKCVISEMPQSARFLSPSSIKALLSVRPLDKPLHLTDRPLHLSVYKEYNVAY